VTPKAAQTLALALHELVTNAAKYGALSCNDGCVTVEWHLSGTGDDRHVVFSWKEQGGPPIEAAPSRKGFGSRLIEATLTHELGGKATQDFAREGVRLTATLPLASVSAQEDHRFSRPRHRAARAVGDPAVLVGCKVLVVEDEYIIGQETAETLRSAGCSVRGPVGTMQEALRIAASEALDVAVLDINLNGQMVWPVAHALTARAIPFIFTTGYSTTIRIPPELDQAPRAEKPVEPAQMVTTLAAALAASSVSRGAPEHIQDEVNRA